VLVAIDGVRGQEVFRGVDAKLADAHCLSSAERVDAAHLVPNLHRLMTAEGAVVGAPGHAPMLAAGPNFVSLPGYMEMLTGRRDTGCTSNSCDGVAFPTIADAVARSDGEAAVIASWPGIGRAAATEPARVLMSVGRHGGENRRQLETDPALLSLLAAGEAAGPAPGDDDFRRDAQTATLALAYLRGHSPSFLFVGLGETDEYAHHDDYRGYLDALRRADAAIGELAARVAELTASGHPSMLLVTTDHGRADSFAAHGGDHPESGRVWLVATGAGVAARGSLDSEGPKRLADIAPTVRRFLGLSPSAGPAGAPMTELFAARSARIATR
jgi:hypothetical protein